VAELQSSDRHVQAKVSPQRDLAVAYKLESAASIARNDTGNVAGSRFRVETYPMALDPRRQTSLKSKTNP
jgi:hypothetical protein